MEQAYLPGTVRQRIQELIKERKITQAELAAEIGMAESSLSRFLSEKTDKIGDEYIIKIADFLGVSTDFIWGRRISRSAVTMILRNWGCPTRRRWRCIPEKWTPMLSTVFWRIHNSRRLHE